MQSTRGGNALNCQSITLFDIVSSVWICCMMFLRSRTVRVHPGVKPVWSRQGPVRILAATGFSLGRAGTVFQALLGFFWKGLGVRQRFTPG